MEIIGMHKGYDIWQDYELENEAGDVPSAAAYQTRSAAQAAAWERYKQAGIARRAARMAQAIARKRSMT